MGVSILGCPGARERDEDNTLCLDVAQEVLLRPQCRTGREGRPGVREAGEDVVASRKADRACAGGRGEWGKGGEGRAPGPAGEWAVLALWQTWGEGGGAPGLGPGSGGGVGGGALHIRPSLCESAVGRGPREGPALLTVPPGSTLTGAGGRSGPTPLCSLPGSALPASFLCVGLTTSVSGLDLRPPAGPGPWGEETPLTVTGFHFRILPRWLGLPKCTLCPRGGHRG